MSPSAKKESTKEKEKGIGGPIPSSKKYLHSAIRGAGPDSLPDK
jgi:hypothetical protein